VSKLTVTDKALFIEEILLDSVRGLLLGRVNELLGEREDPVPPVEFGSFPLGGYAVRPEIRLSACERSEKERIVLLDAYGMTVTFTVPEEAGERNCYAYAWAVATALGEDPTLGGVVERAVLAGKKYSPPEHPGTGGEWGVSLSLRVTVEISSNR
jgi:hypothetical protein